ncbi:MULTISPECIES: hypothetical protein [Bradyrhizobium]|nr:MULTISPECIES: hypothetical protein [Bradyrhizobium]
MGLATQTRIAIAPVYPYKNDQILGNAVDDMGRRNTHVARS